MNAVMERSKYLSMALVLISLLLMGVMAWEWQQGKNLERDLLAMRKIPATSVPAQRILPEFSLPALDTGFPELLARPIFSISRRPFVPSVQADAGVMKKGQFVLVGVLIAPRQRSALLRDVATGKTETMAEAGLVRGMTLGQVMPDRVVLRQGDETEELPLKVQTGPKVVPPQRTMAVPPAPAGAMPPPPAQPAPRPPASAAVAAPPGAPASAPRPVTAQALIQAEKQQQNAMEQMKKQGPAVPGNPPPLAAPK